MNFLAVKIIVLASIYSVNVKIYKKKVENMLKNPKIHYGVINPLPDEWLSRKTDHLKNGFGFLDRPETFWEA